MWRKFEFIEVFKSTMSIYIPSNYFLGTIYQLEC